MPATNRSAVNQVTRASKQAAYVNSDSLGISFRDASLFPVRQMLAICLYAIALCSSTSAVTAKWIDATDEVFETPVVTELRFTVGEKEIEQLGREERPYVTATMQESGGRIYRDVQIKLKGAAGSYREFSDRPALTIKTNKVDKKQLFHGLQKFHLNNSVQDESYLSEYLSSAIFRSAGYPATRVSYARVWLNDRDVGLYVLKEGFDQKFLGRFFSDAKGNLYDGGFLQDVDVDLEKDDGNGPDDHSDLHAITEALRDKTPASRWSRLSEFVDMDHFLSFMALERMTVHWDGYCLNANNYRIYFDPSTKKAVFLPHGMDQMFGDPGMPIGYHPHPLISAAVMQRNEWRLAYRARIGELLPHIDPKKITDLARKAHSCINPVLKKMDPDFAAHQTTMAKELVERIKARYQNLKEQLAEPDPMPITFDDQTTLMLADWYPVVEAGEAKLEVVEPSDKQPVKCYRIEFSSNETVVASWRKTELFGPGKYRFSARTMLEDFQPAENEPEGLRLLTNNQSVEHKQSNSGTWTTQLIEFEVLEDRREIELIIDLRGLRGKAQLDFESMKLERLEK